MSPENTSPTGPRDQATTDDTTACIKYDTLERIYEIEQDYKQLQTMYEQNKKRGQQLTKKNKEWKTKEDLLMKKKVKLDNKWIKNDRKLNKIVEKMKMLTVRCEEVRQAALNNGEHTGMQDIS